MNSQIPKEAVLLIPEPEHEHGPARYGIAPGYYNSKQLLELLDALVASWRNSGSPTDGEQHARAVSERQPEWCFRKPVTVAGAGR